MNQRRLERQLQEYLEGTLDETARREVETVLADARSASGAKARALLDEMRDAQDALAALRDRPTPEAPLKKIQLAIASTVFAGRPEPDMHAWGNRFYKRVAAAAVLLCGLSLGVAGHSTMKGAGGSLKGAGAESESAETTERANKRAPRERNVDVTGEITAFDLMNQNDGRLVTFTPTDAVEPTYEFSGVRSDSNTRPDAKTRGPR